MKLKIVQVPLPLEIVEELKARSGRNTIKDALSEAVYHYISCPHIKKVKTTMKVSKMRGRKPLYLKDFIE
ncbi:DUF5371 family protein [Archaeoglobus profundus]|uniref:Uncharacterized protein n=1 Tax=Archaeoglobus profundus (strain DSM 5631 / JCM 9629 / NBRC 100127 / Av18) TaxID=572546 RepID=D2REA1_ARCPA|nr:DUF5371 family protein [Archaeoglobus profundus]ADB58445.1 hypothetical protein Arcpr_1396 [Archaeoglobus profundus DSM 5631]